MLFLILVIYLVVCYLFVSLFFRKVQDNEVKIRKTVIGTLFLAIIGFAGYGYWEYYSVRCKTCETPIQVSDVVGKWQTDFRIIKLNSDRTYESESLKDPSSKEIGTFSIDNALIKLISNDEYGGQTIEVCEITEDEMYYHDLRYDKDIKEKAKRLK
jgi:hypothetical protein